MKNTFFLAALLSIFSYNSLLRGEIEQISITWNAFKCQNSCLEQIEKNFSGIDEVNHFNMNYAAGSAEMSWSPKKPFSYEPFRYAAAAVGITINIMRMRVQGVIAHDSDSIFLVSTKDNTRFKLIAPIQTEPGRYTPRYNIASHPFSNELREQLLDIEKQGKTVTISGPLYLPANYPNILIAEKIQTRK